ncbi:hypothetical protein D3C73_1008850 [compost metagenome]
MLYACKQPVHPLLIAYLHLIKIYLGSLFLKLYYFADFLIDDVVLGIQGKPFLPFLFWREAGSSSQDKGSRTLFRQRLCRSQANAA